MIPEKLLRSFNNSLIQGEYNLLLGSGISLDSKNGNGELLKSTENLRNDLCALTGAPNGTSLSRAYALMTEEQKTNNIVKIFKDCKPGPSVTNIPHFLWRRIFSFNIDDVIENLYGSAKTQKQALNSLNFNDQFEPTPRRDELQVIHLHGSVIKPQPGFVFSMAEYTRVMKNLNPWMHLLSEILATEPFIISGTSLTEYDLEFYLSHRAPEIPRRGCGPSLLIEPYPNIVTESDCKRFGLILVKATVSEFFDWLQKKYPTPPTISELLVPDISQIFSSKIDPKILLHFFSDFDLVTAGERPQPTTPSPFFFGKEPTWADIDAHADIERQDNDLFQQKIEEIQKNQSCTQKLLYILDDPGSGKSTILKRVAHSLARSGNPVFSLKTLNRIDVKSAIACLSELNSHVYLLIDGLADHIEQVLELLEEPSVAKNTIIIGSERSYRQQHLDLLLTNIPNYKHSLQELKTEELLELIERFRRLGLIGDEDALKKPRGFVQVLKQDTITIAICRILNDFQPLNHILDSLWAATSVEHQRIYLTVALVQHCYRPGIRFSILQNIAGPLLPINKLFNRVPLQLTQNAVNNEFVIALNSAIAEHLLIRIYHSDRKVTKETFTNLAIALAPYVNRRTIKMRSPESRLVRQFLDYDKIIGPMLGSDAEDFYVSIQSQWEWNSRYWEQRALLAAEHDLVKALQFARHAVAIEYHSYPLTTLGKIYLMQMQNNESLRDYSFNEALKALTAAIESEGRRMRETVHPYSTLLSGTRVFVENGGKFTSAQKNKLSQIVNDAQYYFSNDPQINGIVFELEQIAPELFY